MAVGVKTFEGSALFQLSFSTYNFIPNQPKILHDSDNEATYENDHLTDRVMIREMGKGLKAAYLYFDNPIIITTRKDELLMGPANFTNPKKAREDEYPDGPFGYS